MNTQILDFMKFQTILGSQSHGSVQTYVCLTLFERIMQNIPWLQDCFTRKSKIEFNPPKISSEISFELTKEEKIKWIKLAN